VARQIDLICVRQLMSAGGPPPQKATPARPAHATEYETINKAAQAA
jgi:hypothetical protein